jgi:hypothetical protein
VCQRCVDKHGAGRHNAFQPFFMLTWLSQQQAKMAEKYVQEGASADKVIHLVQEASATEESAKQRMDELQDDPTVAKFSIDKVVVVLN